jgi:hypothetical protein
LTIVFVIGGGPENVADEMTQEERFIFRDAWTQMGLII